jgi:hypothetical protein
MPSTPANARCTGSPDAPVKRRLHCSYPIALDVEYKLLTSGSREQAGIGKTVSLSSVDVLFEAGDALPVRRQVEVLIHWPFLNEGMNPLKLVMRGRVIRSDGKLATVRASRREFRVVTEAR